MTTKLITSLYTFLISSKALFVLLLVYALFSLSSIGFGSHALYNLEPYPDGLLYTLTARNAAMGRGLQLVYHDSIIQLWVPPVYPLLLVPAYWLTTSPIAYVLPNTLLMVGSITCVWLILKETSKSSLIPLLGSLVFLSHAYILWLSTVPMSENAALFFFLLCLTGILSWELSRKHILILGVCLGLLLFTRFSVAPVVVSLGILLTYLLWLKGRKKELEILLYLGGSATVAFSLYLVSIGTSPLKLIRDVVSQLLGTGVYYSFKFIPSNLVFYAKSLAGFPTRFLWLSYPITSAGLLLSLLYGTYLSTQKPLHELRFRFRSLTFLLVGLLPLLLVFYYPDSRYSILSIPLLTLSFCWVSEYVWLTYSKRRAIGIVWATVILVHLASQAPHYKELIVANIFHRTKAWQYEAIISLDTFFAQQQIENPVVITALPPFLVDVYSQGNYRVVPVSHYQEFLQKKEYVWGNDIEYADLAGTYSRWLREGKRIFITNAYITHQHQVIADYETMSSQFEAEKVANGCLDACSVYELRLKE